MDFAFTGILDQNAAQEDIFDAVAKPVVLKYIYWEQNKYILIPIIKQKLFGRL